MSRDVTLPEEWRNDPRNFRLPWKVEDLNRFPWRRYEDVECVVAYDRVTDAKGESSWHKREIWLGEGETYVMIKRREKE